MIISCPSCGRGDAIRRIDGVIGEQTAAAGVFTASTATANRLQWNVPRPKARDSSGHGPFGNFAVGIIFLILLVSLPKAAAGAKLFFLAIAVAGIFNGIRLVSSNMSTTRGTAVKNWERARLRYLQQGLYCSRCDLVVTPDGRHTVRPGEQFPLVQLFGSAGEWGSPE